MEEGLGLGSGQNHPLPGVGGRKRDPEGVRSHPRPGEERKQFRSWRERRNSRGVCGQGKERWEPLILESGDSLPVTTSSFSRWDWCGERELRIHPGPGKVEGGRVETQTGGKREGHGKWVRWGVAQTSGTDKPERLLPSQLIRVQITDRGFDMPCSSNFPALVRASATASKAFTYLLQTLHPPSLSSSPVHVLCSSRPQTLQPQPPTLPGSLLPGFRSGGQGCMSGTCQCA